MTQALNFTVKAIESILGAEFPDAPLASIGMRYLLGKLREAQVFILPEYGTVLDRDKPRPEVPGLTFTPPFPVVALEYAAPADQSLTTPGYTDAPASRRIALAWRWTDDMPPELRRWSPRDLEDGVVIASISFMDRQGHWVPVAAAAHISFDTEWTKSKPTPFLDAAIASGRISSKIVDARTFPYTLIPLLPEPLALTRQAIGGAATLDALAADLMDEVNAYIDVCYALSCRNVSPERHAAPAALNKARIRKGGVPLKDFHILKVEGAAGGEGGPGAGAGRRGHLRRGHIRQLRYLGEGRMTWVNATMVKGSGFVDKAYSL
jgi:hypothetical protein